MAVNLPKIADTPDLNLYCNSMKQNDNVTMTFPVNSSLRCFRTAALSMITLKGPSQPMCIARRDTISGHFLCQRNSDLTRLEEKACLSVDFVFLSIVLKYLVLSVHRKKI